MWSARLWKKIETRKFAEILRFLGSSQYWSHEQLREYQMNKISELLNHSYAHVPYYRQMFNDLKIKPRDVRSFNDFSKLPVLTKDIIRSNFENMRSINRADIDFIENSTGGSTGEPLHFFQNENYENWANAARIRGWYHIAGCRNGDTSAVIWGAMRDVREDIGLSDRFLEFVKNGDILLNAFNLSDERKEKFLKYCKIARPRILRGYTTAIREMAEYIDRRGLDFSPVKGIILCAEMVDSSTQEYIEKIFKAPSYNTYGGRELSLIGMECGEKNGLHEVAENNYVEFEPITLAGYQNAGNLVITNLNNYAMPFIRYRIGDIGIPSKKQTCNCGRGLPLIEKVIGRTTEVFEFSDGTRIAGEMFIHLMKDFPVTEYQFVQTSPKDIVMKYKAGDCLAKEVFDEIQQLYRKYLPECVDLSFVEVDKFEKTTTGKFRFVLKDYDI